MAKPLLTNEVWRHIEPVIRGPGGSNAGRPRLSDRAALTGILFVLRTGIAWEDLPQEMGCGCGMTCWRRMRTWQERGIWDDICDIYRRHLPGVVTDWSRANLQRTRSEELLRARIAARVAMTPHDPITADSNMEPLA